MRYLLAVIGILVAGCGEIGSLSIPVNLTAADISFGNGNTVTVGDSGGDAVGTDGTEDAAATGGAGLFSAYDLYVEIIPHSGIHLDLTVTDPTGRISYSGYDEFVLAWPTNSAFEGLHTIAVRAGYNSNPAHERTSFTLLVYQSGELVIDEDFSVAEGDTFRLPVEVVFSDN